MTDFTLSQTAVELESLIRSRKLLNLPVTWADEVVYPAFDGLSLRNIPHSVADLLGAPLPDSSPLDKAVWNNSLPSIDRVVLFLSDGLGYCYLQQLAETDDDIRELLGDLTEGRGLLPLTSIVPSTTAVALPTLWTGASPAQHGMLGTLMFLREFSTMANMLSYKPVLGSEAPGVFEAWGIAPEDFVPTPTLAEHLDKAGIPTYLLLQKYLMASGLSRILHRGVRHRYKFTGESDFWLRLHDVLRETQGRRCYISVYWGAVDSLAHDYGAHNRYVKNEIKIQLLLLRDLLNRRDIQDRRTLFLFTADHGHADAENVVNLQEDEAAAPIREAMRCGMGADNRIGYLYLQSDMKQQVLEAVTEHYPDTIAAVDSRIALESGLFGTPHYRETLPRLGDVILIPRLGTRIVDPSIGILPLVSVHAGLSDWEMLIPLLWKVI